MRIRGKHRVSGKMSAAFRIRRGPLPIKADLVSIDPTFEAVLRGERDRPPHKAGCRFDPMMGTWSFVSTCGEPHGIDHDAPGQPRGGTPLPEPE